MSAEAPGRPLAWGESGQVVEGATMVSPSDLPTVEPHWHTRRITAAEVVRLSQREHVPGLDPADPRVQSIRRCRLNVLGHSALADALREGYLFINGGLHQPDTIHRLIRLWS
jgi:hypothetical protein